MSVRKFKLINREVKNVLFQTNANYLIYYIHKIFNRIILAIKSTIDQNLRIYSDKNAIGRYENSIIVVNQVNPLTNLDIK